MDFQQTYQAPALLAKQFEVLWFHIYLTALAINSGEVIRHVKQPRHCMPFLRRSLEYIRVLEDRPPKRRAEINGIVKPHTSDAIAHFRKKNGTLNLLYVCFKHKTRMYNDAFLSTPRKRTRKYLIAKVVYDDNSEGRHERLALDSAAYRRYGHRGNGSESDPFANNCTAHKSSPKIRKRSAADISKVGMDLPLRGLVECSIDCRGQRDSPTSIQTQSLSQQSTSDAGCTTDVDAFENVADEPAPSSSLERNDGCIPTQGRNVFFHFLFWDSQSALPVAQVEPRTDRRCPICNDNAMTDTGLLSHLTAAHGTDLSFRAVRSDHGALHVLVKPCAVAPFCDTHDDHLLDFVFVSNKRNNLLGVVPFVQRPTGKAATLPLVERRNTIRCLTDKGTGEACTNCFVRNDPTPIRQYYHSNVYVPMLDGDWEVDSDDEPECGWRHKISEELLAEFNDVSPQAKQFMNLWNRFITTHSNISDRSIPWRCAAFVRGNAAKLRMYNFRGDFHLHLLSLWDVGVISAQHIVECMAEYDAATEAALDTGRPASALQDADHKLLSGEDKSLTSEEGWT